MSITLVVLSVLLLSPFVAAKNTGKMILLCITLSFLHIGHKPFKSDSSPTTAIDLRVPSGVFVALSILLFKFPLAHFTECVDLEGLGL